MEEPCIRIAGLAVGPEIQALFDHHKYGWMEDQPGQYSANMFPDFYASYAATVINTKQSNAEKLDQPLLSSTLVHGVPVDIS